jgi:cytochrome c peroxidase
MTGTSLRIDKWLTSSIFALSACMALAGVYVVSAGTAARADVVYTPGPPPEPNDPVGFIPQELPIEVETELAPAGSLKQAPLWKELERLLKDPYGEEGAVGTQRRPSFLPPGCSYPIGTAAPTVPCTVLMPTLNVYPLDKSVLTDEPLRYRVLDGQEISEEISWDQPGALFDPVAIGPGWPAGLLPIIGFIVVDEENNLVVCNGTDAQEDGVWPCDTADDADGLAKLPPDGTVVARPATMDTADGLRIIDPEDPSQIVEELETPINENDFFRAEGDTRRINGLVNNRGWPYGRAAAEVLGKALFWDMQVGSDSVQACGSCHFAAGADPRTRNQLNPNSLGGDFFLEIAEPNEDVEAADFPFHKGGDDNQDNSGAFTDSNDVMSSMGVIFRTFVNIPPIANAGSFGPAQGPDGPARYKVRPLLPDLGADDPDPIPVFQDVRRVEPRNTPMMITAAFNFDNFWDGRARFHFNGGSVFGASDPFYHIFVVGNGLNNPGPNAPLGCGAQPTEDHLDELEEAEEDGQTVNFRIVNVPRNPNNGRCPPAADDPDDPVPVRIKFSSLASQAVGPPLSNFEMSFDGRNWAKIGKKLLQQLAMPIMEPAPAVQNGVVPLANQLVDVTDSLLGPFSNQGGFFCNPNLSAPGKPGLCISYNDLIRLAFKPELWISEAYHVRQAGALSGFGLANAFDPFDDLVLRVLPGPAVATNRNQFTQMEANFSLFFGLSVQAYEQLLIPDNTPFDRFMDANPGAANAVGQPGEQGVLPPLGDPDANVPGIRQLVTGSPTGSVVMVDGFGPDEMFGFDIFAGSNLTAALPLGEAVGSSGRDRLNEGYGSNPFLRSGRCMICHLGPEQTDHTINVNHGLILSDTEFELPPPGQPEPTGPFTTIAGPILSEEVEETAQDGVEVENRNFDLVDDPNTDIDETQVAPASAIAFQDNGIYNIGVRPTEDDIGRGGDDPFSLLFPNVTPGTGQPEPLAPLALAGLAMKNLGGINFDPCDSPGDLTCGTNGNGNPAMSNFNSAAPCPDPDPAVCNQEMFGRGGGLFEPSETDQRVNPGLERAPTLPQLPPYLAPFSNNLPAGELHPQIDELAFAPNTVTPPPFSEFTEIQFGSDIHCVEFLGDPADPAAIEANIWGPIGVNADPSLAVFCPNAQSASPNNLVPWLNGTWGRGDTAVPAEGTDADLPNRVARDGAIKAPQLRMVELTGPFFHTGSYLTLRQVIDFYFRGGDFPATNAEDRDPNLVDIENQAFGFGKTLGLDPATLDGVPDAVSQYGLYPFNENSPDWEENPDATPEPVFGNGNGNGNGNGSGRGQALEDAKESLVKFLLALTDERVAHEQAPFDRPEIFVPLDGTAPDNDATLGRSGLLADARFLQVPAVGAGGRPAAGLFPERLQPFLGVDHFDEDTTD